MGSGQAVAKHYSHEFPNGVRAARHWPLPSVTRAAGGAASPTPKSPTRRPVRLHSRQARVGLQILHIAPQGCGQRAQQGGGGARLATLKHGQHPPGHAALVGQRLRGQAAILTPDSERGIMRQAPLDKFNGKGFLVVGRRGVRAILDILQSVQGKPPARSY